MEFYDGWSYCGTYKKTDKFFRIKTRVGNFILITIFLAENDVELFYYNRIIMFTNMTFYGLRI